MSGVDLDELIGNGAITQEGGDKAAAGGTETDAPKNNAPQFARKKKEAEKASGDFVCTFHKLTNLNEFHFTTDYCCTRNQPI